MNRAPISSQRVLKPSLKRRRPPLACIQCYQRKVKCGRELPSCSRCSKAGNAEACTYRGNPALSSSVHGVVSDGPSGSADAITVSLRTAGSSTETPERHDPASADWNGKMTHLKGQETITKFYGYSYPLNFYQQFTELRLYIAEIKTKNPAINTLRDEIYPLANDEYRRPSPARGRVLGEALREFIPTKLITDTLVQTYIDRFEIIHRVLHIPSFIAEYNRHWASPLNTPASFLVQLLLVTATAASLHPEICIDNNMDATSVYGHAFAWIEAAEAWLNASGDNPPQSWGTLRTNYIQESSFWISTGALVRWAMAAGYHREATPTARISPYYREMRRRLWMTIVELDLQASVERGMPPIVRNEDYNIVCPLNIDDDKLQESMQDLPTTMPLDTLTNTSFQVVLYSSLAVRQQICTFVNGSSGQNDFDLVLQLEEELNQALQKIPEWNDFRADPRQQQAAMYVKSLLSIHLQQYTLLLHTPFAIQAPPSFKSSICRRARLEASTKVLDHYRKLIDHKVLPDLACRTGLASAALNVCHEIYVNFGPHASTQSATMTIFPEVSKFLLTTVEHVLQGLEKRVLMTLHGLNEYYLHSMIIGLVKSKLWPESSATSDKEAADRVIRLCTLLRTPRTGLQLDGDSLLEPG
ncbi:hypothetical protein BJX76DRAFT_366459 [Aspergillus varians]